MFFFHGFIREVDDDDDDNKLAVLLPVILIPVLVIVLIICVIFLRWIKKKYEGKINKLEFLGVKAFCNFPDL